MLVVTTMMRMSAAQGYNLPGRRPLARGNVISTTSQHSAHIRSILMPSHITLHVNPAEMACGFYQASQSVCQQPAGEVVAVHGNFCSQLRPSTIPRYETLLCTVIKVAVVE
jgi:hypothetical protein